MAKRHKFQKGPPEYFRDPVSGLVKSVRSEGGKALHEKGLAHHWTGGPEGTAAKAGRKGAEARWGKRA